MPMKNITKEKAKHLINKHKTRDPFKIAEGENIIIYFEPLGSINGYYSKYARQKFIHINNNIDEHSQRFICAHELGHAVLHPGSSTPFLRAHTFQSVSKLERQANMFAAELLIDDGGILEQYVSECITIEQLACYYCVPVELITYKFYDEIRGM